MNGGHVHRISVNHFLRGAAVSNCSKEKLSGLVGAGNSLSNQSANKV